MSCFNDYSIHRERLQSIPVRLVDRPKLNQNSLNLLKIHMGGTTGEAMLQR